MEKLNGDRFEISPQPSVATRHQQTRQFNAQAD
jgi:hypothetical protein